MGYKFEVLAYTKMPDGGYRDVQTWTGESFIGALLAMRKAKQNCGCVTLRWR